jgi:hypothetical protein
MKYYYWSKDTNLNGIYFPQVAAVARTQNYAVLAYVSRLSGRKIILHIATEIPAGYMTTHTKSIQEGISYIDNILTNNGYCIIPDKLKILL